MKSAISIGRDWNSTKLVSVQKEAANESEIMYKLFFTLHFLIINHAYCQQVIDSRQYTTEPTLNNAPIIGILAQEMSYHLNTKWPGVYNSYIAASYVKFVEGGGARAVPIW